MKPEIAKKWIAALRSGEYKQATGQLRVADAFCCLGVLCNLHAQEHPALAAKQCSREVYFESEGTPPAIVRKWAGLNSPQGFFNGESSLAERNDQGASFETIAKIIEANVEAL